MSPTTPASDAARDTSPALPRPSITPAIGTTTWTINGTPHPRVLVTGAAGGIGCAVACHLHALGAEVIATDRYAHPAPCGEIPVRALDLADVDAINAFVDELTAAGPIHGLVNAAGLFLGGPADVVTAGDFDALWAVNTRAVYALSTRLGSHMADAGGGSIVTIASNSGAIPRAHMVAYGASKTAASLLTRSLGLELGRAGVRCNVVSPGTTRTQMITGLASEDVLIAGVPDTYKAGIPLGKIAEPRDIAHTVGFVLSDQAGHMTAQDIVVDGGASAC
ncbi:2,3-dihydro-2,3-dihydroxybenzoate dehydrogenase [Corynebacterium sp. 13CS0277]|uniref:SDR family oxidoreductase n=1 Tax=Corynebacterium sp. 13CS0277 TaxID=2071994 RepID=UPI000D026AAA|nr:SDR family oxidoreductase [Corynebacterium sp. 13CS0277]PRQ12379.1 2,3-dihydro-2,3-dihydroxybenzoate dehydrogenase [Corynebacterium sp. 13CS0277]